MVKHVITLQPPFDGSAIYLCCSCSDEPIAKAGYPEAPASLVEVNEIAHQHITGAESEKYEQIVRQAETVWGPVGVITSETLYDAFYDGVREQLRKQG